MSQDSNYKATFVILNDVESHGLIRFNQEYLDEEFFENFLEFKNAHTHSINEIISKLDTFQTNYDEIVSFVSHSELSYINSNLEVIKKILKVIVNPTMLKGGFDGNTTLSQMIRKICNKMQYSEKLKKSIRGLFLIDFKTAVENQQYGISKNGAVIYPKDENMKESLSIKDLRDKSSQITRILDAVIDWSNGGVKQASKKTDTVDSMIKELIKQVESLDKKLDRVS